MNIDILCTLIAQRIPAKQFNIQGTEVVFFDPEQNNKPVGSPNESPYATPENKAIVDDVIQNYEFLAAEYQAGIDAEVAAKEAEQLVKAQAYIDNLPSWSQVKTNINNITNLAGAKAFLLKLARVVYWDIKNTEL